MLDLKRILQRLIRASSGAAVITGDRLPGSRVVSPQRRRSRYLAAVGLAVALTIGLSTSAVGAQAATIAEGPLQNAGASHNGHRICLDVNTAFVYPGYATVQSNCDGSFSLSQLWQGNRLSPTIWQLRHSPNNCLWANPQQAYNSGGIYAVPCNANDPYQQWIQQPVRGVDGGAGWQNVGTQTTCLDADGGTGGGAGQQVWQWTCSPTWDALASDATIDTFQVWIS